MRDHSHTLPSPDTTVRVWIAHAIIETTDVISGELSVHDRALITPGPSSSWVDAMIEMKAHLAQPKDCFSHSGTVQTGPYARIVHICVTLLRLSPLSLTLLRTMNEGELLTWGGHK